MSGVMANKELGNTAVCMEEYAWKGLDNALGWRWEAAPHHQHDFPVLKKSRFVLIHSRSTLFSSLKGTVFSTLHPFPET